MSSSLTGKSGRVFTRTGLLYEKASKVELSIHVAQCGANRFVLKTVPPQTFQSNQKLREAIGLNTHVRMHVDENEATCTLVYPYLDDSLFSLMHHPVGFSRTEIKEILHSVGCGIRDMHKKGWVHLDIKPDNIMVDWSLKEVGIMRVERAMLCDTDGAGHLLPTQTFRGTVGTVLWRGPECHTGEGICSSSDVFSFGLTCLFACTGAQAFHVKDDKGNDLEGLAASSNTLCKQLMILGPVPQELVDYIGDAERKEAIVQLGEKVCTPEFSHQRLANWDETVMPNLDVDTKRFVLRMLQLAPPHRASMEEIMEDKWWTSRIAWSRPLSWNCNLSTNR